MKADTTTQSTIKGEYGKPMKGADVVVESLIREGVDVIFAYPGGASLEMHQSLVKREEDIRTILPRHEQGGGFMAHGYARATGKAGVCMATSGPGATNLVTCIADAYMDSIPLVVITGQVYQEFIGKAAFQETDFLDMTMPVVKHSYLVLDEKDLTKSIKEAFHLAQSGRPGPVVIDVPKDIQQKVFTPFYPEEISLPGYPDDPKASDDELKQLLQLISESERPVLYTGGGIISSNSSDELKKFVELTGVPQAATLMGLGALPADDPKSLSWFGMHGCVAGNWAVYESDLLICAGARFDDRITGEISKFAPDSKIVHIDLDRSEHNKNKKVDIAIHSEIGYAIKRLNELWIEGDLKKPDLSAWIEKLDGWKKDHPFSYKESKHILPQEAIEVLHEETNGEAIITTGVGQHQMWAAQFYKFNKPRHYISSLGLGTMGFGYPSALGAKVAYPEKQVVDIDGDGSFLMNVQELATATIEKINAKVMILNNQHLGMVTQWEDRFYDSIRGQTILCDHDNIGGPENEEAIFPNYPAVANGFGVASRRVIKREELRDAIREMLAHDGPFLLDVVVPHSEHVLPMIPQKKSAKEIITE